jgi:hypothetical protein
MAFALGLIASGTALASRFPAPRLIGINSPLAGMVEITMEVSPGDGGYVGAFLVYRAEGESESFAMLKRAGYPHYFMDTTGSPEFSSEDGLVKIIISGLKSGTSSYYITQALPWTDNTESVASNTLSTKVVGHLAEDGDIEGSVIALGSAGVEAPIAIGGLAAYPNPAAGMVRIPLAASVAGVVRVYDATGVKVMESAFAGGSAEHRLDVAGLAAGTYYTETIAGARVARSRFTVLR